MPTSESLDPQIRSLVAELVGSAPPPPLLESLEWREPATSKGRGPQRSRRRVPLVLGGVGAGIAVGILVAVALLPASPLPGARPPAAAAAELHLIGTHARQRAVPVTPAGQWLRTSDQVTFFAQINDVGDTPTPDARATVTARITEWSNELGQSCISATSGPAQFATAANRAAWIAAGLVVTPHGQPATGCTNVDATETGGGVGAVDVASLPTDPATLARELSDGTTGIAGIDQHGGAPASTPGASSQAGFERAALLLIGPSVGATPAFTGALYDALALLPGIRLLGVQTSARGTTGIGFAVGSGSGQRTIVVDPATGALVEARNISDVSAFQPLGFSYLAPPPTRSIETAGGGYQATIVRFDPLGSPEVASLPAGMHAPAPQVSTAKITATTKPGVTSAQLFSLQSHLTRRYGSSTSASGSLPASGASVTWELTSYGTRSQASALAATLRASGLFASVHLQFVTRPS